MPVSRRREPLYQVNAERWTHRSAFAQVNHSSKSGYFPHSLVSSKWERGCRSGPDHLYTDTACMQAINWHIG
jgi:hypothetical protein